MADIPEAFEQYLRSLSDDDWSALTGRVRSTGGPTDALRTAVAKHVSEDRLNAIMAIVNPTAFVGDDGRIDETKVGQQLGVLFGDANQPVSQRWQNAGQHSAPPPLPGPGDSGKAEAAKRFGTQSTGQPNAPAAGPGATGRAEAQRRFGKGGTA